MSIRESSDVSCLGHDSDWIHSVSKQKFLVTISNKDDERCALLLETRIPFRLLDSVAFDKVLPKQDLYGVCNSTCSFLIRNNIFCSLSNTCFIIKVNQLYRPDWAFDFRHQTALVLALPLLDLVPNRFPAQRHLWGIMTGRTI